MKEREYGVDVIRIMATFVVIATHVKLGWIENNVVDNQRLFFACLWSDGVSLFFLITGFFLFNGREYKKIIKKCIKSIILPVLIVVIASQIIGPWILDSRIFCSGFNFNIHLGNIVHSIMRQSAGDIDFCFHFWYIFTYIKVILFVPLLKWICQEGKEQNLFRRGLIILSILYVLVNDLKKFVTIDVNFYNFFDVAILLVLIGYEISLHKNKIMNNTSIRFICVVFLFAIGGLRFYSQKKLYEINIEDSSLINWDSIFGIFMASLFFIFIYSFDMSKVEGVLKKCIVKLSGVSFYVYLIHVIVYLKLESMGVREWAINNLTQSKAGIVLFNVIYPLGVSIICILFIFNYQRIKHCIEQKIK